MHRARHSFRERQDPNHYWLARTVVKAIEPFERCVVWVTTTGVWPSRENLHLYYTLRRSHYDYRLLEDAPGHLLLRHEKTDLVTCVFLALVSGWDAHVIPSEYYAHVFVSHDGWLEIGSDDADRIQRISSELHETDT